MSEFSKPGEEMFGEWVVGGPKNKEVQINSQISNNMSKDKPSEPSTGIHMSEDIYDSPGSKADKLFTESIIKERALNKMVEELNREFFSLYKKGIISEEDWQKGIKKLAEVAVKTDVDKMSRKELVAYVETLKEILPGMQEIEKLDTEDLVEEDNIVEKSKNIPEPFKFEEGEMMEFLKLENELSAYALAYNSVPEGAEKKELHNKILIGLEKMDEKSLGRFKMYVEELRKKASIIYGEPVEKNYTVRELKEKAEELKEKMAQTDFVPDKKALETKIEGIEDQISQVSGIELVLRAIEDLAR